MSRTGPRLVAAAVVGAVVGGCGADVSRYEQTWETPHADTTCVEWTTEMTKQQQFAMAADLLTAARINDDEEASFPEDQTFEEMQAGIQELCEADLGYSADEPAIPALGLIVYSDDRERFAP